MRYHHTKNKGDLGVVEAMADLTRKGWSIFVPLTEHEAFDLVAYREGVFLRVQVKYRTMVRGCVEVQFKSIWADRNRNHYVPLDRNLVDVICIHCPDTETCYYVDPKRVATKSVCLRVLPTRNNIAKGVVWAKDFTEIPQTVLGVPTGLGTSLERLRFVRQSREPRATWLVRAHSSVG